MKATDVLYAECDDVILAYRVLNPDGSGMPLVMIQGWSGVKEDWGPFAEALAQDRPVLIYDNRGMGESGVPAMPYTIEMMALDAVSLMDRLGWHKAHVLGISMGGMIAQQLAVAHGERLQKLVLGCTGHGGGDQIQPEAEVLEAFQYRSRERDLREMLRGMLWVNYTRAWIEANPTLWEAAIDRAMAAKRPRHGFLNQMNAVLTFDLASRLGEIDAETLVVHGTGDVLIPFANARLLEAAIPNSRLHALENAGHVFWQMDDGDSARVVRDFLAH